MDDVVLIADSVKKPQQTVTEWYEKLSQEGLTICTNKRLASGYMAGRISTHILQWGNSGDWLHLFHTGMDIVLGRLMRKYPIGLIRQTRFITRYVILLLESGKEYQTPHIEVSLPADTTLWIWNLGIDGETEKQNYSIKNEVLEKSYGKAKKRLCARNWRSPY